MKSDADPELGIKKVTKENWFKPDFASAIYICKRPDEENWRSITNDDWIEQIADCQLAKTAPLELRKLYEVAKALIIYAFLFYPFYTLAFDRLTQILEGVVAFVLEARKLSKNRIRKLSFSEKVERLIKEELIKEQDKERWLILWDCRNEAAHPTKQRILLPGMAIDLFYKTTEDLNNILNKLANVDGEV